MGQISKYHAIKEISKDGSRNIEYLYKWGGKLPDDWSEKLNIIIINDVLHDSFEVNSILEETKNVLKPDGFAASNDPTVSSNHNKILGQGCPTQFAFQFIHLPTNSSDEGLCMEYIRRKLKTADHGFRIVHGIKIKMLKRYKSVLSSKRCKSDYLLPCKTERNENKWNISSSHL